MTGWLAHLVTELLRSDDWGDDPTLQKLGHCMFPGILVQSFLL